MVFDDLFIDFFVREPFNLLKRTPLCAIEAQIGIRAHEISSYLRGLVY